MASDIILLAASVAVFALLAKFTDQSARAVCWFIRGVALILAGNCVLSLLGLPGVSLNLFTVPLAGTLGVPAIALILLINIFL